VIVVKKIIMACPGSVIVLSKIPLVLTTNVTHLRNLLFKQQDRVNSVVRIIYLENTAKLVLTSVAN